MAQQEFGEFIGQKMRDINPNRVPSAVGFVWYRRETYDRCKAMYLDGAGYQDTFDAWLADAEKAEKQIQAAGQTVVRAYVDPIAFPIWAAKEGFQLDHHARTYFANMKAMEWMVSQERTK